MTGGTRGITLDGQVTEEETSVSFKTGRFRIHGPGTPPEADPPTYCYVSKAMLDGKAWLMLLHVLGAVAITLWVLRGLLTMQRTLGRATEVPDGELRRRFIQLSEQLGLRSPTRLLLSHEPFGPAAFGVLRPAVIVPEAVTQLEASALDAILAHELAHHRRRDPWINWIQLALTAAKSAAGRRRGKRRSSP